MEGGVCFFFHIKAGSWVCGFGFSLILCVPAACSVSVPGEVCVCAHAGPHAHYAVSPLWEALFLPLQVGSFFFPRNKGPSQRRTASPVAKIAASGVLILYPIPAESPNPISFLPGLFAESLPRLRNKARLSPGTCLSHAASKRGQDPASTPSPCRLPWVASCPRPKLLLISPTRPFPGGFHPVSALVGAVGAGSVPLVLALLSLALLSAGEASAHADD